LSNRYYNIDLGKYNVGAAGVIGHSKVNKSFKKFYDSFIKVLHEEEYDANTIYGFVQEMKRIMRHVFGDSDIYIEPYFKHFVYQRNLYKRVLLSSDQYDFFVENYRQIRNDVKPSYRPFVDYWYVALFTCARHKDMGAWTESNLSVESGINFLNYTTSKGGVAISIPLKQEVLDIFKNNIDRGAEKLMVDVNNVSKTIKKVAKGYPIFCEPIVVERIKGGQKVTTTVPYWTMMTLHKMRGSGMTAMRRGNVPDHVIKQWSSHKENSEAFGAYFDTEKKELLDTAKSFYG
jgi:integrase